jgi:hypothetical protein
MPVLLFSHNVVMPIAIQLTHLSRNLFGGLLVVAVVYWGMQVWQWAAPLQQPQAVVLPTAPVAASAQWATLLAPSQHTQNFTASQQLSQWQLLGIVSTQAEQGLAMFRSPSGEELLVRTGQELAPGLVLQQVNDSFIYITIPNGQTQQIAVK